MKELPQEFIQQAGDGTCLVGCPSQLTADSSLEEILIFARRQGASDVHVCSGACVMLRKGGVFVPATKTPLHGERVTAILKNGLPSDKWAIAEMTGDMEYVHVIPGAGRYRSVVTRQRLGWDMTVRLIDMKIRSFEESGMPIACQGFTKWAQGLVLIAGPAGCGKTSTLATLVEMINQTRQDHIIVIEEPIEVVYKPKRCQVTQREIGVHTLSATNALKAALREDPDIIVVGELRDPHMIGLAVSAAETGHLVFGTMNTNDASQTVATLINSFEPVEQPIIRNMVAESLRGVVCQQLIPRLDGTGVVPAYEVLVTGAAVTAQIKKGQERKLNNVIATGRASGMILLDYAMQELVARGVISGQEAFRRAIDPNMFVQYAPSKVMLIERNYA
ncbi:MAG: PilT/PilU family type 4a pilus ATPase [Candidatus Omnitrophica bacterium]|nr:PilT/PilU family type 4a pilus ATPase [Candidatus Omnitrophota bacterium]